MVGVLSVGCTPVCLIENDDLLLSLGKRHLLLREHFDLVPHDVDAPLTQMK